jgi:hypothetical protein
LGNIGDFGIFGTILANLEGVLNNFYSWSGFDNNKKLWETIGDYGNICIIC